jgi:hypothetical protein
MTRFELVGGHYTEVLFYTGKDGKTQAFPKYNAELVEKEGTEDAKKLLHKILGQGGDKNG